MNNKISEKALANVFAAVNGMNTKQVTDYLSMVANVSICALRGVAGNEFVDDFLNASLNDPTKPTIKIEAKH